MIDNFCEHIRVRSQIDIQGRRYVDENETDDTADYACRHQDVTKERDLCTQKYADAYHDARKTNCQHKAHGETSNEYDF